MDVYRVAKWNEVFENAESRRLKNLTWVSWPVSLDSSGYHALVEQFGDDAPAIYGAWAALVSVAASCSVRGTLADSKGRAYSIARIALKSHMPVKVFERLTQWAASEDVGWLEVTPHPAVAQRLPDDSQGIAGADDTNLDGDDLHPSVHPSATSLKKNIVIDSEKWETLKPVIARIARVVTGNKEIDPARLRSADGRLAMRAAALAQWRYGAPWLDGILESISEPQDRKEKPWGYFRGALVNATDEQFGESFRDTEKLVKVAAGATA